MPLDYFERKALTELVSSKSVPGQIDRLELAKAIHRGLANDELEEVKRFVLSEFGAVAFETPVAERAPLLIWRRSE